jgi:hypothetical protein
MFAGVRVMMFNTTFNNNSAISWWLVLLLEETEVPGKKPRRIQTPNVSGDRH